MASQISLKDQFLWVSNQRLSTLIGFAVQVGGETAQSVEQRRWVEQLRQFDEQAWPGIDFDLDERFPSIEEKTFWARVFDDLGNRIFLRQLGNQEDTLWQSSAIGDTYIITRMLSHAVQEAKNSCPPGSVNPSENEGSSGVGINIRM